jgi:hypothetical protein
MTEAHLESLASFGYTPEEAHFLYLVATHSGYFLGRQFLGFTRAHWGKRTTRFWAKLQSRRHARAECFPSYGLVHHVFAPKLYRHLGRESPRSGREHEVEYVQRRIAMFDFVLSHLEFDYLETEPEKRAYFEQTRGIPADALPCRTYRGQADRQPAVRYFVDRFPMSIERGASSPVVTFSYIQPAAANLTEFQRHLVAYLPLFRELPAFRLVYLARSAAHFDRARELFESLVGIPLGVNPIDDLLRYFAIRKAWDLKQYGTVSESDLIFRNRAKQRFAAARFEDLYEDWKGMRIPESEIRAEFPASQRNHEIHFEVEVLKAVGADRAKQAQKQ